MKHASVLVQAVIAVQGVAAQRQCWSQLTPERLEAAITPEGLERHLRAFDRIGQEHDNNRAFGTSGYEASSDYLIEEISSSTTPDRDFRVWKQYFNHTYAETRDIALTGPDGEDVEVYTLTYNHPTEGADGVTTEIVDIPIDDSRGRFMPRTQTPHVTCDSAIQVLTWIGSGCYADQWEGIDVTGKLALVKRGVCAISDKLRLGRENGAAGVLLVHNTDAVPNIGSLGAANIGLLAPVGMIPLAVGEAWFDRLAAGEELTATLLVDAIFEERETWNVFAETVEGDADNVIVLGAHLDSVAIGPGLNDDASGVVAQIEILRALRQFRGFPNKILLAWWGAEEVGLVGSLHYTEGLTSDEADRIRFYFNYDMIGSPEPVYGIYVGENPADRVGAQLLLDYLVAHDKPAYFGGFGTGSDYLGFLNLGIPSSGIHTGGGGTVDPCYHLPCDVLANVNLDPLTNNTRAAAVAAAVLALSVEDLPPRNDVSFNPLSKNRVRSQFDQWRMLALEAEGGHRCALGDSHFA
ncbi:hypothetical protein S7711_01685 [Stachybotrys chartarum IBT 7711]|uniref:Peptide hydrolase n=1 Tax=Stachybotrys chartarum (strain CBS 109288 / IBT 7711) TaxID=1280523 RepID=A0A084AVA1_STACB|nr:hypothetical protein S7711_01685 [Stachybotrys chartarum IBT 7711]KFA53835.1 hypothetical protein S40293_01712 [Stachybotrys chartarum IBT 40293]